MSTAKGNQADIRADLCEDSDTGIAEAYREHGYRLQEIAAHLGVHYATASRKLRNQSIKITDIVLQDLTRKVW